MSFLVEEKKVPYQIDYTTQLPVSVVATYNQSGNLIPLYFRFQQADGSSLRIAITGILRRKEYKDYSVTYLCQFRVDHQFKQTLLTFHFEQHIWTIPK